jgi:hypothetical protein
MAIPILNHLDFQKKAEIQNVLLHTEASGNVSSPGTGQIIYDSGTIKFYNGSSWVSLGTGSGSGTVTSVTAGDGMTQSGTNTINPTLDVVGGDGITANANDVAVTAAQTTITSIYNASLAVGYGASHANIDFSTDNAIIFDIDGTQQIKLQDGALVPITDNDIDLGTSSLEFKDAFFDGTVTSDAFAGPLTGSLTIGGHLVDDIDVTSEASDADDHLMTALAIKNRIEDYGYTTDANVTHRTITAGGNTLAGSETLAFTAGSNISISESAGAVTITGTDTNTNTGADMTNATLLTKLAALESTSGAADENIVIGTDSGDTIVITGNLQVSGTTTTVNSTTVNLNDHNIVLDSGNSTSAVVADAGITLEGGSGDDVTWMWDASNTAMTLKLGSSLGDAAFGTIELGHATDTTIARSGSGDITIEGNAVYRAGGTDVPVADGGTGASTLTDGGVLLGSGTGAITAMAVLADGEMIVGDGTTDPVAESGATLRTSIGVDAAGTDNSTNVTLAGTPDYITISGQQITRNAIDLTADVTGVLPAANLPDAGAAAEGVVELATASEVQTGTDAARVVTADTLAAKSVTAVILTASLDGTENSAVINHALDTTDLIVQAQMIQETGESAGDYNNCIIDWECTTDGSTNSDNHIYVKFADAPPYDVTVNITSIKGATAITPTYPS